MALVESLSRFVRRALSPVWSSSWTSSWMSGPWRPVVRESYPGAWQQNVTVNNQPNVLAFSAVFACVTGISADIGKMRIKLVQQSENDIWTEITSNSPYLPVLRRPNHYQNRIQFLEAWVVSKLCWGNAYVLKERDDARGIVTGLYVLDPQRVSPLVADNGDIYYKIGDDALSHTDAANFVVDEDDGSIVIPAREMIHDTMICLFHPLIGVSPIYACGLSATMGNKIQLTTTSLFANGGRPGGILTAPGRIDDKQAERLKTLWEEKYTGANAGRIAILGDGLKYEPGIMMSSTDSQLIEQLRWTVEDVARAFHFPFFKLTGNLPPYAGNTEAMILSYYTDCLQELIEKIELHLDEGLELPSGKGAELDLENLLRMDTASLFDTNAKAIGGGWMSPNEARHRANLAPVAGGDSPYIQQQNFSLEALAKRDALADPFAPNASTVEPEPDPDEPDEDDDEPDDDEPEEDDEPDEEEERRLRAVDFDAFNEALERELIAQCKYRNSHA